MKTSIFIVITALSFISNLSYADLSAELAACKLLHTEGSEDLRNCAEKAQKKEAKKEATEYNAECKDIAQEIKEACGLLKLNSCHAELQKCAKATGKEKKKACANILGKIPADKAKESMDDAKDSFEISEEKAQDLQEKLSDAQQDALKSQQKTEEQIQKLQAQLNDIPLKATQLQLENESERDRTLLDHIDNMNKLSDELQGLTDAIHDAETNLTNKRNELLQQCELEARGKQQAKINEKNSKRAVGKYTVASLSEAMQTSYTTTQSGKKVLRNTKEIIERFERCQKTRFFQTSIQAAERTYQRTLMALESKRKSLEKQSQSLNARLETSLKLNTKASELKMAQLAKEQSSLSQNVLSLQKQLIENQQQAQANIAQIQQNIQKAQFEQYQKQQSMFSAINAVNISTQQGSLEKDEVKTIETALAYFQPDAIDAEDDEDSDAVSIGQFCALKNRNSIRATEGTGGR